MKKNNDSKNFSRGEQKSNPTPIVLGFARNIAEWVFIIVCYLCLGAVMALLILGGSVKDPNHFGENSPTVESEDTKTVPTLPSFENPTDIRKWEKMK